MSDDPPGAPPRSRRAGVASAAFAGLGLLVAARFFFFRSWPFGTTDDALDFAISLAVAAACSIVSRSLAARASPGDPGAAAARRMGQASGVIFRLTIFFILLAIALLYGLSKSGFRL